jgi:D-arabinose 1-dehydrogenase-like Zn-dependent alcohol dehydrogenase
MRAVEADKFGGGWQVVERPVPTPEPGQVLVRVLASGICYTDVHNLHNPAYGATFPRIPGHEFSGEVVQVGNEVAGVEVGQLVGVQWTQGTCRTCFWCLTGREEKCAQALRTGGSIDGGHAEYAVAYADGIQPLPRGLDPVDAAVVMCAGYTVYSGLADIAPRAGEHVAVAGIGGLGHLAVQYAHALGARVTAVTGSQDKAHWLLENGASAVVDPDDERAMEQLAAESLDAIVACGNALPHPLLEMLAPYGRLSVCGVSDERLSLDATSLVFKKVSVFGSSHGPRSRLGEALALHGQSGARAVVETFSLDRAVEALARVQDGSLRFRAVIIP